MKHLPFIIGTTAVIIGLVLGLLWLPIIDKQNASVEKPTCTKTTIDKYYPCKPVIYTPVLTR